jgi:hypothetical protein
MKKILYILLFLPLIIFGQEQDPCYSINDFITQQNNTNPPISYQLSVGWNMVGYTGSSENSGIVNQINTALSNDATVENTFQVIKNVSGQFWSSAFAQISDFTQGEGYMMYVISETAPSLSFNSAINIPEIIGCTDCTALNFNIWATLNDESCNYDTDGDGVYDADEIIGCLDDLACNFENVADATDNGGCNFPEEGFNCGGNELSANIGDTVYGGIVFYIDSTGQHGLVAALSDLEEQYKWGCYGESVEGADGIEIGTGLQNTIDIVNSNCMLVDFFSEVIDGSTVYTYSEPYEGQTAAGAAYEHESGGYDDWYLPSKDELYEMYSNIGGPISGSYWSSSEYYNYLVWFVNFYSGSTLSLNKYRSYRVRVIRAF